MSSPKYPEISVRLVGENGNAFYILGKCLSAMRRANISKKNKMNFIVKPPPATTTTYSSPVWNGLM